MHKTLFALKNMLHLHSLFFTLATLFLVSLLLLLLVVAFPLFIGMAQASILAFSS